MSAEMLREAASAIREDYAASETGFSEDDPFMFAVADWLELQAERLVGVAPDMVAQDHPALAAARTYMGDEL